MKRLVIAVAAVFSACEGNKAPPADTATVPAPAPVAAVLIGSPVDGDTTSADVTVVLSAQSVGIAKASGMREEGVGHHHLFLDTLATPDGGVIPPNSSHVVHIGTGDSTHTFRSLAAGPHEIIAVIGYGDHAAMSGRRDTVRFVVRR